ncbi:MAG TPA: hypothetical protein VM240_04265 [Verrucomicrobiae bacterium]|nr:hypothetical protein [Verrucomicrobiae bacterium]
MKTSLIAAAFAALLAGCGSTPQTVIEADTVIAGRSYRNQAVSLGRVKLRVALLPQAPVADGEPAPVEIMVGFATSGEPLSVVAAGGSLVAKKDGARGELVGRQQARGTGLECVAENQAELGLEYWFNGKVQRDSWRCVVLRFTLAGHRPGDPLELQFEPINVGGELQRLLPVTFAYRTEQLEAE